MENTYQLTEQGFQNLKEELERLKDVDRKRNLDALKEARAQGDLSENADYDSARDEQARIEGRVKEIEGILKNFEIIKEDTSNKVNIGKTVVIKVGNMEEETYKIVGSLEANPLEKRISNESPIGRAFLGKHADEVVEFQAPKGMVKFTILEIN